MTAPAIPTTGRWTRRSVAKLKRGDIISPEYNWCARILKVAEVWNQPNKRLIVCDPYGISDMYNLRDQIWDEIVGPHEFMVNQRPLFWDGPDDLVQAFNAGRFP